MDLTPKRLFAYCDLIRRNRLQRYTELINLHSTAAQGEAKAIQKLIDEWDKDF